MTVVVLVIQLFFTEQKPVRAEVPVISIEECHDAAKQVFALRDYQGERIISVAAGCHLTITDKPA
jgi:hypothetical protein